MRTAEDHPFLGASTTRTGDVVILGMPLDLTESFLTGTREGPARIRTVSDVLETYSPALHRDLAEIQIADWGDLDLSCGDMTVALHAIEQGAYEARRVGFPILVGGEHTATLGSIRGVLRLYPDLVVIQVDAHLDLRETYNSLALSHATVMRRVAEDIGLDHLVQLGIRSGTREEFDVAPLCLWSGSSLQLDPIVREQIADRPVYLSLDIDVLDPAYGPGTGCPEPGGFSFGEVATLLYSLANLNVVGADVVEVLPAADVNDITSVAAAKLIRELALLYASPRT